MGGPVGFSVPGWGGKTDEPVPDGAGSQQAATPYKIPPVVWMVLFLVVGFVGVRMLMED